MCAPRPTPPSPRSGWRKAYHVDADHIRLETVDRFIAPSDFFTIDVAESIGKAASGGGREGIRRPPSGARVGTVSIPRIDRPFEITRAEVKRVANAFLLATRDAASIYRHICKARRAETFSSPKFRWTRRKARRHRRSC